MFKSPGINILAFKMYRKNINILIECCQDNFVDKNLPQLLLHPIDNLYYKKIPLSII